MAALEETELAESALVPVWEQFINVRLGGGYKDNIGLGQIQTESSPFWSSGLELMMFRLREEDVQFQFYTFAEDRRYMEARITDKEQTLITQLQVKRGLGEKWTLGFTGQYLYQDEVFDASTTETDIGTIKVQVHTVTTRPRVRFAPSATAWVELEPTLTRQNFLAPLDDYWEGGPVILLGWTANPRTEWQLSYEFNHRVYDSREALDLLSQRLPGTALVFQQHETQMSLRHYMDEARQWRTLTRLSHELNQDTGSGFFQYSRYRFAQQIQYRRRRWRVEGGGKLAYYDYARQTAGISNPSSRGRMEWAGSFRLELPLADKWKCYVDYEYLNARSNRQTDGYTANVIAFGFDYEF